MNLLLDHGASVNALADGVLAKGKHADGHTALHLAAKWGTGGRNEEIFSGATAIVLLDHGADVRATTIDGETPLHWAAKSGSLRIATILLAHNADVNAKTKSGTTPLALLWANDPQRATNIPIATRANENWNTLTGGWSIDDVDARVSPIPEWAKNAVKNAAAASGLAASHGLREPGVGQINLRVSQDDGTLTQSIRLKESHATFAGKFGSFVFVNGRLTSWSRTIVLDRAALSALLVQHGGHE